MTRSRLLPALITLALFIPAVRAAAQDCGDTDCGIVDRGDPTDGVTTITVLQDVAPCDDDALFEGWDCMLVRSEANDNGVAYDIDIRWNRVGQACRGSFTWLIGGDSTKSIRKTAEFGAWAQDRLDTDHQIRTIEIRFHGDGTMTPPRNGFVNISAVYADVLEFLVIERGIAVGVIGHYGNSGGSMIGANALAYHEGECLLDGIVLGGGPFWTHLDQVCTNPDSPIFLPYDEQREKVDVWNWFELIGATFCVDMMRTDEALKWYCCRSTLGELADRNYPNVIVADIVGTRDHEWILASALDWYYEITAQQKTFDTPDAPHLVPDSLEGASTIYRRIRDIVRAKAGSPPANCPPSGPPRPAEAARTTRPQ